MSNKVLTQKQIDSLMDQAKVYKKKGLREGQSLMNALFDIDPDLYREISSLDYCDPFYDDKKICAFWDKLTGV